MIHLVGAGIGVLIIVVFIYARLVLFDLHQQLGSDAWVPRPESISYRPWRLPCNQSLCAYQSVCM